MNQGHTAALLGVGNLGRALMENFHFDHSGFRLTAAFDIDPEVVGHEIAGIKVRPIEQLPEYLKKNPTSVGILTVPRAVAPSLSEKLIEGGVKGIWNFTNIELNIATPGIIVENVHFSDSLLALSYLISEAI